MTRWTGYPQLADIERLHPSGALYIACDGTCEGYRRARDIIACAQTYYFYSKREALALWREQHPRGGDQA